MLYLPQKSNKILLDLLATYKQFLLNPESKIYLSLRQPSYMDLTIEKQEPAIFSISHSYVQNGDLMYDPSIEFIFNINKDGVLKIYPLRLINHSVGYEKQCAYLTPDRTKIDKYNQVEMKDIVVFTKIWLNNIKHQKWYLPRKKMNPKVEVLAS